MFPRTSINSSLIGFDIVIGWEKKNLFSKKRSLRIFLEADISEYQDFWIIVVPPERDLPFLVCGGGSVGTRQTSFKTRSVQSRNCNLIR